MKTYTLDEWEQTYKPVPNHLNDNTSWENDKGECCLFNTHGAELEFVRTQPYSKVWTYIDTDKGTMLCAGYHTANRIGYLITELPWTDLPFDITITLDKEN